MKEKNITIIGAGIGGLATALGLLKLGLEVSIYEQNSQAKETGAGLQLSQNATHILSDWGLLETIEDSAFKPQGISVLHWKTAKDIARFHLNHTPNNAYHQLSAPLPYLNIHRQDLHNTLLTEVLRLSPNCLHADHQLINVIQTATDNYQLEFQHRHTSRTSTISATWLIGADGIHSKLREFLIPQDKPASFTGNIAWRGLIETTKLKQPPKPRVHLAMGPGAHLVFYYVRGGSLLNYVAVKEQASWQEESWTSQGQLQELLADFQDWSPTFVDLLSHSNPDACYRWALHDREPMASWGRDQCFMMGDAVHPMLPYLAQGAAMAIEDAAVIAQCFKRYDKPIREEVIEGEQMRDTQLASTEPENTEFDSNALITAIQQQRAARTARVQTEARRNMKIYHTRNPLIQVPRDLSLKTLGLIKPDFMQKKMSWLYDFRV